VRFAGQTIRLDAGQWEVMDRLGSVRATATGRNFQYMPYGEAEGGVAGDGRVRYGTYVRDSTPSAQDYAWQRYYSNFTGRFFSPDRAVGTSLSNPGSWNRYAYVNGDPVNASDPSGMFMQAPPPGAPDIGYCDANPDDPDCIQAGYFLWGGGGGGYQPLAGEPDPVGGGGGGPAVSDAVMSMELKGALADAQKMLAQTDCASLFGLPGPAGISPDPSVVLEMIANFFTYGAISPSAPGTVTSATTVGQGSAIIDIGNSATMTVSASVVITLNNTSNGASFVSGSGYDQAVTLLHELGHAYWDLFGPGTSQIAPDGDSATASQNNTNLVKANCK